MDPKLGMVQTYHSISNTKSLSIWTSKTLTKWRMSCVPSLTISSSIISNCPNKSTNIWTRSLSNPCLRIEWGTRGPTIVVGRRWYQEWDTSSRSPPQQSQLSLTAISLCHHHHHQLKWTTYTSAMSVLMSETMFFLLQITLLSIVSPGS